MKFKEYVEKRFGKKVRDIIEPMFVNDVLDLVTDYEAAKKKENKERLEKSIQNMRGY